MTAEPLGLGAAAAPEYTSRMDAFPGGYFPRVYRYLPALVCSALVCSALFSLACRSASGQQTAVDDIPALTARVRQSPEDPNANYSLGLAYFRQQRLREARPFLDRAAALSPAEPDVWKALGLVLLGLDDFAAAVEPLRQACELASGDPDACYLAGPRALPAGAL